MSGKKITHRDKIHLETWKHVYVPPLHTALMHAVSLWVMVCFQLIANPSNLFEGEIFDRDFFIRIVVAVFTFKSLRKAYQQSKFERQSE